jgi:hypothetical protein
MTRNAQLAILGLALLTILGFVIVSRFFGDARNLLEGTSERIGLRAPSRPGNQPGNQEASSGAEQVANLNQAEGLLRQIEAAVSAKEWDKAQRALTELETRTERLPGPRLNHPDVSPILQDLYTYFRVGLARALAARNAQEARLASNQLLGILRDQSARLRERGAPIEFERLGFLLREIAFWREAKDEKMTRVRIAALLDVWSDLKPILRAYPETAQSAAAFDELVEKLKGPEQIVDPPAMQKQFDALAALFAANQQ